VSRYHALTHETSSFFELLCDCTRRAIRQGEAKDVYRRICRGPLVAAIFQQETKRNVADSLAGGATTEGVWAILLRRLSQRLDGCQRSSQAEQGAQDGSSKKRRINNGSAVTVNEGNDLAAEFGILSRLICILLDTVIDSQVEKAPALRSLVEEHYRIWQDMRSIIIKSTDGSSWAREIRHAGITRLLSSALRFESSLQDRANTVSGDFDTPVMAVAELRYESVRKRRVAYRSG
jgi:hypothetical protein